MITKDQKEKINEIIRKTIEADKYSIAAEIASNIKKELGIEITNKQVNTWRKQMGLAMYDMRDNEARQTLEDALQRYRPGKKLD